MTRSDYPPTARKTEPGVLEHARRIKAWTRTAIGEDADTVVSVIERACAQAGCPPRQTIILVLSPGRPGRKASIHKPLPEVTEQDVTACLITLTVML